MQPPAHYRYPKMIETDEWTEVQLAADEFKKAGLVESEAYIQNNLPFIRLVPRRSPRHILIGGITYTYTRRGGMLWVGQVQWSIEGEYYFVDRNAETAFKVAYNEAGVFRDRLTTVFNRVGMAYTATIISLNK